MPVAKRPSRSRSKAPAPGSKAAPAKQPVSDAARIRAAFDLPRARFARLSGFSERALANWESGKQAPDAATLRRLRELDRLRLGLQRVMRREFIPRWLDTPSKAFGGLKPLEAVERGEIDRLWAMIYSLESGAPA